MLVRETRDHVAHEHADTGGETVPWRVTFAQTSFSDPNLSAASQAGFVNDLNDGMAWGLLPLFYAAAGLSVGEIGVLAAAYPAVWGVAQIATGGLSDRIGRKPLIVVGMLLQAVAIAGIAAAAQKVTVLSACRQRLFGEAAESRSWLLPASVFRGCPPRLIPFVDR